MCLIEYARQETIHMRESQELTISADILIRCSKTIFLCHQKERER